MYILMIRRQAQVELVMMGADPCQRIRREAMTTVVVPQGSRNHCPLVYSRSYIYKKFSIN